MLVVCTDEVVRNTTVGLVSIFVIGNDVVDGAMIGEGWEMRSGHRNSGLRSMAVMS